MYLYKYLFHLAINKQCTAPIYKKIIHTFSHNLQRSNYQAIVNLAFDSLDEPLIFQRVLGHMHQQLSKCETSNRKGVDEQRARDKPVTLEQLQQPLAVIESPARPKELFDLW